VKRTPLARRANVACSQYWRRKPRGPRGLAIRHEAGICPIGSNVARGPTLRPGPHRGNWRANDGRSLRHSARAGSKQGTFWRGGSRNFPTTTHYRRVSSGKPVEGRRDRPGTSPTDQPTVSYCARNFLRRRRPSSGPSGRTRLVAQGAPERKGGIPGRAACRLGRICWFAGDKSWATRGHT